jgi:hypothetical protein
MSDLHIRQADYNEEKEALGINDYEYIHRLPQHEVGEIGVNDLNNPTQPHADHIVSPSSQHIQYRNVQPIKWPLSSTKSHNRICLSRDGIGDFMRF